MKNLPELLVNGITFFLLGKEVIDSTTSNNIWKNLYDVKCAELSDIKEEILTARSTVVDGHNCMMALMQQVQNQEKELCNISKAYYQLVDQVESLGLRVGEDNTIIVDSDSLEDMLDEEDEPEVS